MQTNRITTTTEPATGLLAASIDEAERDPDDVDKLSAAIRLLRQRQLRRADVQTKLGAIFEQRISRGGQA